MSISNKTFLMALGMGFLLQLTTNGQVPRLPVYEVARTRVPINVDGKLDDPSWAKASPVGDFVNNSDGSASQYKTEAKVLYDDHFLYFSFRCVDDNIWASSQAAGRASVGRGSRRSFRTG